MPDSWSTAGLDLLVATAGSHRRSTLEEALRTAIQSRRLPASTLVPSTRALAEDLGLSRGTVTAAYDQLVAEGYLVAQAGSGTRVADLGRLKTPDVADHTPRPTGLDLLSGIPDLTSFPVTEWLRCARRALTCAPASAFGYGNPRGRIELRTALAEYLGRTRGVHARPEQIVITAGATQAVSLLCTALAGAGSDRIAMENPGFNFHRGVVRQARQHIVAMPVDADGATTYALADAGAAVVSPAHQYPMGVTMHPTRRHSFTRWARRSGGLVIEDDYDGEFRYDRQPVGALQGTDADNVVYIGTTSKTLGPGLRQGWMVLPDRLVGPVLEVKVHTDLSGDAISQLTLAELITSHGYDRHIRRMRARYRRRRDLLVAALDPIHPQLLTGIPAGLHTLLRLPAGGPSEAEILAAAKDEGLALEGAARHWHGGNAEMPALLIGFARPSERAYPAAVSVLARVLRRALH